ncbi:MAG: hypothetical protein ACI8P2_003780 [Candidatus Latescibacterota bacterium]|jgi:hypothetical protein
MSIDLRKTQIKELELSDLWHFAQTVAQAQITAAAVQDVFDLVLDELERRGENISRCNINQCRWTRPGKLPHPTYPGLLGTNNTVQYKTRCAPISP